MLGWGGPFGVARERRPEVGADPADPAYDWRLYDQAVLTATSRGVRVLFTINSSPEWANLYQPSNVPPQNFTRLKEFAYAAAIRYSGVYRRADGVVLPRVSLWTAWNEPNIPLGLKPQWRRLGGRWVIHSAWAYARICNAVYDGIHSTLLRGQQVACGVTTARGNNAPGTKRPSVAPIGFLRAAKAAGMRNFDAYAHHPYAGSPGLAPGAKPKNPARDHAREHPEPDRRGHAALRAEADLDHRVRLRDEPAGPRLRRRLGAAGPVPARGLRDRPPQSQHRDAALVPVARRGAQGDRLAVGLRVGGRSTEAVVLRVPAAGRRNAEAAAGHPAERAHGAPRRGACRIFSAAASYSGTRSRTRFPPGRFSSAASRRSPGTRCQARGHGSASRRPAGRSRRRRDSSRR